MDEICGEVFGEVFLSLVAALSAADEALKAEEGVKGKGNGSWWWFVERRER